MFERLNVIGKEMKMRGAGSGLKLQRPFVVTLLNQSISCSKKVGSVPRYDVPVSVRFGAKQIINDFQALHRKVCSAWIGEDAGRMSARRSGRARGVIEPSTCIHRA